MNRKKTKENLTNSMKNVGTNIVNSSIDVKASLKKLPSKEKHLVLSPDFNKQPGVN